MPVANEFRWQITAVCEEVRRGQKDLRRFDLLATVHPAHTLLPNCWTTKKEEGAGPQPVPPPPAGPDLPARPTHAGAVTTPGEARRPPHRAPSPPPPTMSGHLGAAGRAAKERLARGDAFKPEADQGHAMKVSGPP